MKYLKVKSTKKINYETPQKIYDISMKNNHNFFASNGNYVVHNCTQYNHGENSMADTIVGLAQDYTGSNNINLFEPIGQFGSILSSESASHRYIFTKPHKNLREFFKQEDDCILEHRYEDGDKVEPKNFYPTIPMWIVNGAVGIGTGHSVKLLPRDPDNISVMIERLLDNDTMQSRTINRLLKPTFLGWSGEVLDGEFKHQYEMHGTIEKVNATNLKVTELPIGYGVDKFKKILVDLMDKGIVRDFDNNSTDKGFNFEIKVSRDIGKLSIPELKKQFKLISKQSENITLWDKDNKLKRFDSIYDALKEFIEYRLERYEDRRLVQLDILNSEMDFLYNKKLFILEWNNLENPGKMKMNGIQEHMKVKGVKEQYIDRLMALRISSLSLEQINELEKQIKNKKKLISYFEQTNKVQMYKNEL